MASKETSMSRLLKLAQEFNCFYLKAVKRKSLWEIGQQTIVGDNKFAVNSGLLGKFKSTSEFGRDHSIKKGDCRPFVVAGHQVGLVRPDVMTELLNFPEVFVVHSDSVMLNPAFRDYNERTISVEKVLKDCKSRNAFITLKGWRDECYEVRAVYSEESLLKMDRCATCLFGICNYGVDINGYVNHPEKGLCIWLQRRSKTKQTWPGRWDNMVGGGLSVGFSVLETAYKEAEEEASITNDMMKKVRSGGCVSFFYESERGLFPNTEFVFDLELPIDFIPKNNDGEVETFELLPAKDALERVLSSDFKTTSCPVVIDFLIRHGYITPDNEPNFPEIVELLHVPLQSVYRNFQLGLKNGDAHQ